MRVFFYIDSKFKEIYTMFDLIIREAASRFGLGDKAGPLVQMLLAYLSNKDTGGLSGFISKLTSSGLGNVAQSWLGGGAGALPVSAAQIESLMGGQNGLLSSITSKLGLGGSTATSALGFLLPMVIGKLTPGGTVPTSLSSDVMGFITGGASALTGAAGAAAGAVGSVAGSAIGAAGSAVGAAGAAAGAASVAASKVVGSAGHAVSGVANAGMNAASAAGGGLMKWLPWLAAGIAALFLLSYCNKGGDAAKQAADGAKNAAASVTTSATTTATAAGDAAAKATADAAAAAKAAADKAAADTAAAAKTTADAAAKAVAEAIPAGAGLVGYMADGMPALKVYFDSGKTAVAKEFGDKSKDIVEFLKANAGAKAIVSGYNDPTGNAAANAELSKNRAKGVAAALKAAGIADDRLLLEKPANTTAGAALSNEEARRVEVTIRK
jgi:uncharacterized protein YidB (DUF937 family)/outer membrane protein OmpA-like peptidoglycan-associated protein